MAKPPWVRGKALRVLIELDGLKPGDEVTVKRAGIMTILGPSTVVAADCDCKAKYHLNARRQDGLSDLITEYEILAWRRP